MDEQRGYAQVNGTSLYHELTGTGHPLVLIHGFTLDTRMWDDQFEVLAQHYKTIRYDVRGFGRSAVPTDEDYTHADDLRALLEHLEIAHAHILGLSMGGEIAIDFALAYPEVADSVIAVDSALGGFQGQWCSKTLAAVLSTVRECGIPAAKKYWLGSDLFKPAMSKPRVAARLSQMIADYTGWHLVNNDPARSPDVPALQRLSEISAPTLVIVGEHDLSDFCAIANILHQHIPVASKVVLPGVGHMCNMEDPDQFNETVLSFLRGV
jgi:3-oxoadipate enol-lactonase